MKLFCIVHANELSDIIQAVHAVEAYISGYMKMLDYRYKCILQM